MFIPIIVLSKFGDNNSSMGGDIDDESNNWLFDIEGDVVELSIWSDWFYTRKKEEKKLINKYSLK